MARLLGEEWEGDVRVRYYADEASGEMTVERHQDAQTIVDRVAGMNLAGVKTLDGLGKPVAEVPLVAMIEWCKARGIPWEKMAYGNDYDDEFKAFIAEHSRLQYEAKRLFAVTH